MLVDANMQDYMLEQFLFLCALLAASVAVFEGPAGKASERPHRISGAARLQ